MIKWCSRVAPAGWLLAGLFFTAATAQGDETAPNQPSPPSSESTSQPSAPMPSDETTASAEPSEVDSMDVIVCKTEPPLVGSRLGKRKICKTRREWRDDDLDADGARRLPEQRGTPVEPGIGGGAR